MQADTAASHGAINGEIPFQDCWQLNLLCINALGVCVWPEPLVLYNQLEHLNALRLVILAMLYLAEAANVVMQGAPICILQAQLCNQSMKGIDLIDHKISSACELQFIRPFTVFLL